MKEMKEALEEEIEDSGAREYVVCHTLVIGGKVRRRETTRKTKT
jgi:hypothetical protein